MNPFTAVLDGVDSLLFSPPASPMSASAKKAGPVRVALIGAGEPCRLYGVHKPPQ